MTKKRGVLATPAGSKGTTEKKNNKVEAKEAPVVETTDIKDVIKEQKEEKKEAQVIAEKTTASDKTPEEIEVENSAKLNNLAANEKIEKAQNTPEKPKAKAEFYTRGQGTSWVPVKKDFGGSLEDVRDNKFNYPLDMNSQGAILFSDGSIVEAENRQVRNGNYSELLKEVKTAQKKIDAAKKSAKQIK